MARMNYYNNAQHVNSAIRMSVPVTISQVEINSGESVRFWIEPWLKTFSMERVLEAVEDAYAGLSRYDYAVSRLPEGPVELEVYNYPINRQFP